MWEHMSTGLVLGGIVLVLCKCAKLNKKQHVKIILITLTSLKITWTIWTIHWDHVYNVIYRSLQTFFITGFITGLYLWGFVTSILKSIHLHMIAVCKFRSINLSEVTFWVNLSQAVFSYVTALNENCKNRFLQVSTVFVFNVWWKYCVGLMVCI